MNDYTRDIVTLQSHASMWWTQNLRHKNAAISIIPKLLQTQDDFISILKLSKIVLLKFLNWFEWQVFQLIYFLNI